MHAITKAQLAEDPDATFTCTCCDRPLNPKTLTWLELHSGTNEWARAGKAPWSDGPDSQGSFPFGAACARRRLAEQRAA